MTKPKPPDPDTKREPAAPEPIPEAMSIEGLPVDLSGIYDAATKAEAAAPQGERPSDASMARLGKAGCDPELIRNSKSNIFGLTKRANRGKF